MECNKLLAISLALAGIVYLATLLSKYVRSNRDIKERQRKPNVIIFLADDVGFDFRTYGHPTQEWGPVDDLARQGMMFTQWTSAHPLCSPSRAALLTGRYAIRNGVFGKKPVFMSNSNAGLPKEEVTLAEALRDLGYETGFVGKWHLGMNELTHNDGNHLPYHHGYQYVGTILPFGQSGHCDPDIYKPITMSKKCFLYRNSTIIEQPINLKTLSRRILNDAKNFITENKDSPFYLQYSFPQTHIAMFCDEKFCGKSRRGKYGDNINEMAWAIGEVMQQISELKLDNTIMIFLSDHGPEAFHPNGGVTGYFRGLKGSTWEGGVRVPAIITWPGKIPPNTINDDVISTLDIFPTILSVAGDPEYLKSRSVFYDGKDISRIFSGETANPAGRTLYYYCSDILMAVRHNRYKIHYMTHGDGSSTVEKPNDIQASINLVGYGERFMCEGDHIILQEPPLVFDLEHDPGESYPLTTKLPEIQEILKEVKKLVDKHKATIIPVEPLLSRSLDDKYRPCCNYPQCTCNYSG